MAVLEKDGVIQVHQSHLSKLSQCGLAFAFRYVENFPEPVGTGLVIGRGVHAAARKLLQAKVAGDPLDADAAIAAACDDIETVFARENVQQEADDPDHVGCQSEAIRLVRVYIEDVLPHVRPVAVEQPFVVNLEFAANGDGEPLKCQLAGRIDVVTEDGLEDLKTAARTPTDGDIEDDLQGMVYAFARRHAPIAGGIVERPTFRKRTLVKTKVAKCVTEEVQYGEEVDRPVQFRVAQFLKTLKTGAFQPANPSDWWCRSCGYRDRCPAIRKRG